MRVDVAEWNLDAKLKELRNTYKFVFIANSRKKVSGGSVTKIYTVEATNRYR